ncbi:hypothetical protein O5967_21600 [Escherichia coli]|nr:hypothetical protein [Escherichia coli]
MAKESGIRPSRTLAGSVVASQVAISGSPISAAMAAMLTIMEVNGVSFIQVMSVCLPTSFAAAMVAAFIASRQGCELQDDEVYLERLQKDWCKNTRIIAASSQVRRSPSDCSCWRRSLLLFLLPSPTASGF